MYFKRTAALALVGALAFSTVAMADVKGANEDAVNTQKTEDTLNVGFASEPSAIWGSAVGKTENEGNIIQGAILDTLVAKDYSTNEIIPWLATEWEWVDETHCKFTLRDDVTMSDGTPLVADDVVYSFNVFLQTSASTDTGRFLGVLDDGSADAVAEDEHTVTIGFNTVAPDMLEMMTMTNFGIVSEDEVEALGGLEAASTNPQLGSGKYKFVEWNNGQNIKLERNEDYWNTDYAGYYQYINITFINDPASRAMSVQSGDLDVAYDMPVTQAATYAADESLSTIVYTFGQTAHLWYNMTEGKATSDSLVRQAIDKALNFDALAGIGTAGYGEPSLGYFTSDSAYYNETYTTEERAVDIEGAKELLAEAGYADGLEITALGLQDTEPLYTVMQANLAEAGITLNLDIPDTAQFVEAAFGGDYDIIMVGEYTAARYPTLFCFLQEDRSAADVSAETEAEASTEAESDGTVGTTMVIGGPKVTTKALSDKIFAAIEESDEAKAIEELGAIEQELKEDCIVTNLYPEMKAAVLGGSIKGYTTQERGFVDLTNFYEE